jgi:hypothetical protein
MTYATHIKLWSANGHTPITHRQGAYCDVLLDTVIQCETPAQAENEVQRLKRETEHAVYGHFYMPDYPNQNIRSRFV